MLRPARSVDTREFDEAVHRLAGSVRPRVRDSDRVEVFLARAMMSA
jgi:hypothetical protein